MGDGVLGDAALLCDVLSSAGFCPSRALHLALPWFRLHVHFTFGNIFFNDTKHGVLNAGKPQDFGNVGMRQGDRGKKMFPKLERVVLAVPFGKEQVFEGDARRAFSVGSASNRARRATRQVPARGE